MAPPRSPRVHRFSSGAAVAAVALVGALVVARPASGQEKLDKKECPGAAEKTQRLRSEGKLREAREQAVLCARAQCPGVIRKDCEPWLSEIDAALPTIVVGAKDGGKDVIDVKVSIDGAPVATVLDGKSIAINPGAHTFRYEREGSEPVEEKVVIREGEKARQVTVVFPSKVVAKDEPKQKNLYDHSDEKQSGGSIVPGVIVGALGVAGIGSFFFFHLSAKSDLDELRGRCAPRCTDSELSDVNTKIIIADVSLGAGVVALGIATYLIISRPSAPKSVQVGAGVAPTPGGAIGGISGSF
ncbi:MAG: hypothetical protein JWM74_5371 [Myxococcaceae bacterium]|nr:hypothetical protein [Myxococcaceae bacterium]